MTDFSKIGKQNRSKGIRFERRVAELFQTHLNTPLVRNLEQSRKDLHGDLVHPITGVGPFNTSIECKSVNFTWNEVISGNLNGGPLAWLAKSCQDVEKNEYDKHLLVFRDNTSNKLYGLLIIPNFHKAAEFYKKSDELESPFWVLGGCMFLSNLETMVELLRWNFCKTQTT